MTTTCQGCGTQFAQRPTGPCVSCGFSAPAAPAEHAKCFAADGRTPIYNIPGLPLMVRAVDFNAALASQTTAPALSEPVGEVATDGGIDWVLDGPADWEPGTKVYLAAPNQTPAPAAQGLTDAEIDRAFIASKLPGTFGYWMPELRRFARAIIAASRTTPTPGEATP